MFLKIMQSIGHH